MRWLPVRTRLGYRYISDLVDLLPRKYQKECPSAGRCHRTGPLHGDVVFASLSIRLSPAALAPIRLSILRSFLLAVAVSQQTSKWTVAYAQVGCLDVFAIDNFFGVNSQRPILPKFQITFGRGWGNLEKKIVFWLQY